MGIVLVCKDCGFEERLEDTREDFDNEARHDFIRKLFNADDPREPLPKCPHCGGDMRIA